MADLEDLGLDRRATYLGRAAADAAGPALLRRRDAGSRRRQRGRALPRSPSRSRARPRTGQVEDVLAEASQLLSGLSHGAGVVIATKADLVLKHIEFIRLDAERAMVVLVGEDGSVETASLPLPAGLTASTLTQASNYLAHFAVGKTIGETLRSLRDQRGRTQHELDELTHKLVEAGLATLSGSGAPPTVIVRGRANLINDTMASEELSRIRQLFDELESRDGLIELLGDTEAAQGKDLHRLGEQAVLALGQLGDPFSPTRTPTRRWWACWALSARRGINYARIVPVVDYTANVVSAMMARKG